MWRGVPAGRRHWEAYGSGGALGGGIDTLLVGENETVPSRQYPFLRAALTGTLGMLGSVLELRLQAGFRYLLSVGDLTPSFGTSGGGYGFDARISLTGRTSFGMVWAVTGDWLRYGLSFSGAAFDEPAIGGYDQTLRGSVELGASF